MAEKEDHYVTLTALGSKLRLFGSLLTGFDPESSLPVDTNIWFALGEILDEMGSSVLEISKDLEKKELKS
jgi:hypothetical protein